MKRGPIVPILCCDGGKIHRLSVSRLSTDTFDSINGSGRDRYTYSHYQTNRDCAKVAEPGHMRWPAEPLYAGSNPALGLAQLGAESGQIPPERISIIFDQT